MYVKVHAWRFHGLFYICRYVEIDLCIMYKKIKYKIKY